MITRGFKGRRARGDGARVPPGQYVTTTSPSSPRGGRHAPPRPPLQRRADSVSRRGARHRYTRGSDASAPSSAEFVRAGASYKPTLMAKPMMRLPESPTAEHLSIDTPRLARPARTPRAARRLLNLERGVGRAARARGRRKRGCAAHGDGPPSGGSSELYSHEPPLLLADRGRRHLSRGARSAGREKRRPRREAHVDARRARGASCTRVCLHEA